MNNRSAFMASTLALSLLLQPNRSDALVVACANCSTNVQQLLDYARQAEQLSAEVNSLKTQIAQYNNMVTNTISLPQSIWSNVLATTSQVRNLANGASLLAGNSGVIGNRLNSAQNLAYQAFNTPQAATDLYTTQRQTLGNATTTLGRVLGVQQQQEIQYARLQEQIQTQSAGAEGTKQALQAGNQLLALNSTQLNQIQTTLMAQAQVLGDQAKNDADRQALNDYSMQKFMTFGPVPLTGGKGF